jgi:hypothetical protein
MNLDELLAAPQYSLTQAEKERYLLDQMQELVAHHRSASPEYARILASLGGPARFESLADVPYLPVGLFKSHRLSSVPEAEVFKTMTSSGTTGQQVSRVILDRTTAQRQTQALAAIMTHVLGPQRLPMIVVDTPNVVKDRRTFSARGAGVLGMLSYGRKHFYALDDDMALDHEGLAEFLRRHSGEPILIFGFTFMVWQHFLRNLAPGGADLSNAILVHSGGWKKLADEAVGNAEFKRAFHERTGITRVHNFYGMVEQVGSVFMEGTDGYLHPPNFADVIVRDPRTWEPAPDGKVGVIQVLSALPTSYPGHSILTEDLGVIHAVGEPSSTSWGGKRLEVIGRVPRAELRGCSDTHAAEVDNRVSA